MYVGRYQTTNDWETEIMSVRWNYFEFKKQILEAEQKNIQPSGKYFAKLALIGEIKWTYSKPIKNINTKSTQNQIFITEILVDEHQTQRNQLLF